MTFSRTLTIALSTSIIFAVIGSIFQNPPTISVSAALPQTSTTACVGENFTDLSLNPAWNWVDPLGDSLYSLSANPGYLRIQAPAGNRDFATGNKNAPRLLRSISGDFDIQTRLTVNPVQTYQSAGLFMWIDEANFMWIGRSVGNVIGHKYVRNNSEDGLNPPQPNYSDTNVYFRMVRQANTFSTYYSGNGVYWNKTGSLDYPAIPDVINAGVFLLNNWQDNPIQADFDFYRVNCKANLVYLPLVTKPVKPAIMEKTVFAIAYIDATPINDPDAHQKEFLAGLREGSTWHGYANPNGQPSLGYTTYGGSVIRLYENPPHRSDTGQFDYAAVYQRFDLCTKIQQGLVDEVWIWESGDGNAWEWVTNGPHWSWTGGSNVPNCGKTVTTLNLNYQRETDVAYESYSHRLETALKSRYPCEFFTETWPWTGWPSQCTGLVSDRFGFVARPFAGNDYVAVCGDAHSPPNILVDNRPYVYDDLTVVNSICEDWQWDGTAKVSAFNCTEWSCTHRGYHIWWMQNLPGYGNNNHDRYGNLMPNWWESLFE